MVKLSFTKVALKIASLLAFSVLSMMFLGDKAHAATIDVAAGNDENTDNSSCSLTEAIENINDQAQTNSDCLAGDGIDDTIELPSGTITLTSDLPQIAGSVNVHGQGINQTIINGASFEIFRNTGSGYNVSFQDLKIVAGNSAVFRILNVNFNAERVEVDKAGGTVGGGYGTEYAVSDGGTYDVSFQDVYVHDVPSDGISTNGISIGTIAGSTINLSMDRITVSDIDSVPGVQAISITTGLSNFALTPGTINVDLQNITVTNINSSTGQASGMLLGGAVNGGEVNTTVDASNITITDISGISSAALAVIGIAVGNNDTATTTLNMANGLIDGACAVTVPSIGPPTDGTHNLSFNSLGGNISSDPTCEDFFTQSTDQNNITDLASTLGPISDNGGFVPTIPLLDGSPAIDSGVTVAGLTTDARLAARPQGNAFDSGAYESPFTQATSEDSQAASLADTGQRAGLYVLVAMAVIAVGVGAFVLSTKKR